MKSVHLLLLVLFLQFFALAASNGSFHYGNQHARSIRNPRKKPKDECDCQCPPQKVIAVQQEVEIPRVQIVEESDETAKNFHEFKLYKLAKDFNGPIEQRAIDKKEIRKLLEKQGYY